MKNIITILLLLISSFVFSQDRSQGWKPEEKKFYFKDSLKIDGYIIFKDGDTATIVKVNDSICVVINGDTVRIDGSGSIDNETDPIFTSTGATQSALEDTASALRSAIVTGGGIESDPVFTASDAFNITSTDITNLGYLSGTNTGDQDTAFIYARMDSIIYVLNDTISADSILVLKRDTLQNGLIWTQRQIDSAITANAITQELIEDYVGAMVSGNTETNITVTYQDADGTLDFVAEASGGSGGASSDTVFTASNDTVTAPRAINRYPFYQTKQSVDSMFIDTTGMNKNAVIKLSVVDTTGTDSIVFYSQIPIRFKNSTDTFNNTQNVYHDYWFNLTGTGARWKWLGELMDTMYIASAGDVTAPTFVSAEIGTYNDSIVVVIFSENLHQDSIPSKDQFGVSEGGTTMGIAEITINADTLFIALDSVGHNGLTYTMSYTHTIGDTAIQDSSYNQVANFADSAITNNISSGSITWLYEDNFDSYTDGALVGQGNWISGTLGAIVAGDPDNYVYGNTGLTLSCVIYNQSLNNDQRAGITVQSMSSTGFVGAGVRITGSGATLDGYGFFGNNSLSRIFRIDDGVRTNISQGAAFSPGDVLWLEAEGTTITLYRNGVVDATHDNNGFTDANYSSGQAGLMLYDSQQTSNCDDWRAGNIE